MDSGTPPVQCDCTAGWSGQLCDENVDDCAGQPCQNGAECIDGVDAFSCVCATGFTGLLCTVNTNDCAMAPCENGGVCEDGADAFVCHCAAGYEGDTCSDEIDECAAMPCENGAECTDLVAGFACSCAVGWAGVTCSAKLAVCTPLDCDDGDGCTVDSCDDELGCHHTAKSCDDSSACTSDSCHNIECSAGESDGSRCLAVLAEERTWAQAGQDCADLGGTLATINSASENATILALTGAQGCAGSWIGLNDTAAEGAWTWSSGAPFGFSNWAAEQPDNFEGSEHVVAMDADGAWSDEAEAAMLGCAICEIAHTETPGACGYEDVDCSDTDACTDDACDTELGCVAPETNCDDNNECTTDSCDSVVGCQYVSQICADDDECTTDTCIPATGECSYVIPTVVTPTGKYIHCAEELQGTGITSLCAARGMTPVALDTDGEEVFLRENLSDASWWIGLSDAAVADSFVWPDGSAVGATNWCDGQPDEGFPGDNGETCVKSGGCWSDAPCGEEYLGVICELDCEDGDPCTDNYYDTVSEGCVSTPTICVADDVGCTSAVCTPGVGCEQVVTTCDDASLCTDDSCEAAEASCAFGELIEGSCYQAFDDSKKPLAAAAACQELGGHLVSIASEAENTTVRTLADAVCPDEHVWIGLTDELAEGNYRWPDGTPLSFTFWGGGEPNADASDEDWVEMLPDGKWNDKYAAGRCYVCETAPTLDACDNAEINCDDNNACTADSCEAATGCAYGDACVDDNLCTADVCVAGGQCTSGVLQGGRCYDAVNANGTWTDAEAACVAKGGHLVSVASTSNNTTLRGIADASCGNGEDFWIGLYDPNGDDVWSWTDPLADVFSKAISGADSEDPYVAVDGTGGWYAAGSAATVDCYICELSPVEENTCANPVEACDDGLGCTATACEPETGCTLGDACSDGLKCSVDTCAESTGCEVGDYSEALGRCVFATSGLDFTEGRATCDQHGGDLITVASEGENAAVLAILQASCADSYALLGYNDRDNEGTFTWDSGADVTYENWAQDEPAAGHSKIDAVWMNAEGTWENKDYDSGGACTICEYAPIPAPACEHDLSPCK